jgi:hypothetical protein
MMMNREPVKLVLKIKELKEEVMTRVLAIQRNTASCMTLHSLTWKEMVLHYTMLTAPLTKEKPLLL